MVPGQNVDIRAMQLCSESPDNGSHDGAPSHQYCAAVEDLTQVNRIAILTYVSPWLHIMMICATSLYSNLGFKGRYWLGVHRAMHTNTKFWWLQVEQ